MSTIQFACPFCGAVAEIEAEFASHDILCPACGNVLQLPPDAPPTESVDVPALPGRGPQAPAPDAPVKRPARSGKRKLWQTDSRAEPAVHDTELPEAELPPALAPAARPPRGSTDEPVAAPVGPIDPNEDLIASPSSARRAPSSAARSVARVERERRRYWSNAAMLVASTVFMLAALAVLMYLTNR